MVRENEEQALREYGNRKKRYKKRRNFIICSLLLIVVVVGVAYCVYLYNRSYENYKVIKSVEITGESTVGYLSYGSSVIKYGKNGAIAYDKDGKILWNGPYEMSDPIADICGKYIAIADRGNKSVHIFNDKGAVGDYSTNHNIEKIKIASQGVAAVLMEAGTSNYFMLYDEDGTELAPMKNTVNNAGYPLDIALSNDGKKLVVIYMSVTGGELISNVACYNFDEVGKNSQNQMVGGYHLKKGVLAPRVEFLNNDTFCVYKENGFKLNSMLQTPKDIHEETVKGKIQSVFYNKKYTGMVLEEEDGSAKHLIIYNLKGEKVLNKTLDFAYKKISLTEEEIIMYDDLSCIVMKMNGKIKFKHTFDGNISGFYPINNLDRYFLINETKLSTIQLTQ